MLFYIFALGSSTAAAENNSLLYLPSPISALQLICLERIVSASSGEWWNNAEKDIFALLPFVWLSRNMTVHKAPAKAKQEHGKNGDTWRALILHREMFAPMKHAFSTEARPVLYAPERVS